MGGAFGMMDSPQGGSIMPWSTPAVSELRTAFVHAVRTAGRSVSQAARDFRISRKTAYKWLARFDDHQPLLDPSRKPLRSPRRTADSLQRAVLAVRDQYGWGPRKIHAFLTNHHQLTPPVRTIADILRRHHRIAPAPSDTPQPQRFERSQPNELWQLDFKGWVEIERTRVSPLTVLDDHSRFLLALCPCTDLTMRTAWNVLWNVFGEFGLPQAIICDEALGDQPPLTRWRRSERPRPEQLPEVHYPPGSVLRRVGSNGLFEYRRRRILAGQGLVGEQVRVEESDGGLVVFYAAKEIRRIA